MLTVFFARHGESRCSRRDVLCGRDCDAALTERGEAQAQAIAASYGGGRIDGIYASVQRRARDTAAPLGAARGIEVMTDERLSEIAYGSWDGAHRPALPPEALLAFGRGEQPAPGGESLGDVAARASRAFAEVRERHPDGQVWIFSHHTSLRLLLCALLGFELSRYRSLLWRPGAVSQVRCDDASLVLVSHGSIAHLAADQEG